VASPFFQSIHLREVTGSTLGHTKPFYIYIYQQPIIRCHVAALDWATWHLTNQPQPDTCRLLIGPRACHVNCRVIFRTATSTCCVSPAVLPCQPATSVADVTRATCHPFNGDTCQLEIGPNVPPTVQIHLPRVTPWCYHVSPIRTCDVSHIRTCHVSVRTDCTDRTVNKFFCLFDFSDRTRYLLHTEPV
jgi:hypothetical protein